MGLRPFARPVFRKLANQCLAVNGKIHTSHIFYLGLASILEPDLHFSALLNSLSVGHMWEDEVLPGPDY